MSERALIRGYYDDRAPAPRSITFTSTHHEVPLTAGEAQRLADLIGRLGDGARGVGPAHSALVAFTFPVDLP